MMTAALCGVTQPGVSNRDASAGLAPRRRHTYPLIGGRRRCAAAQYDAGNSLTHSLTDSTSTEETGLDRRSRRPSRRAARMRGRGPRKIGRSRWSGDLWQSGLWQGRKWVLKVHALLIRPGKQTPWTFWCMLGVWRMCRRQPGPPLRKWVSVRLQTAV